VVSASYQSGALTLTGAVSSAAQHYQLVSVAAATLDSTNVFDGLTVDAAAGLTDADAARLAVLLHYMVVPLEAGEVGWGTDGVYARGAYTDEAARAQFAAVAVSAGVEPVLVPRPVATAAEAAALQNDLNTLVGGEPILFGRGVIEIAPESIHTVQRIAGLAKRYGGVRIEVQGHTDDVGNDQFNLELSQARADAVIQWFFARGVAPDRLTAVGYGETAPMADNGTDAGRAENRRVEFRLLAGAEDPTEE